MRKPARPDGVVKIKLGRIRRVFPQSPLWGFFRLRRSGGARVHDANGIERIRRLSIAGLPLRAIGRQMGTLGGTGC